MWTCAELEDEAMKGLNLATELDETSRLAVVGERE